jgi:3-dehydroquinate synthase
VKNISILPSSVFFGEEAYQQLHIFSDLSNIFILVDSNTRENCLPYLHNRVTFLRKAKIVEVPFGEKEKNLQNCIKIWKEFEKQNADRKSLLINLGGGVISDMGGFSASVFKRGIRFLNVPTTLLAMVDASSGGKTGIDFHGIKNEIGLFKEAELVIIDLNYLKTLGKREKKSGMAEIFKYGLVADSCFWKEVNILSNNLIGRYLIEKSIFFKNRMVLNDPKDKFGSRKILNFGHTIGHAFEAFFLERHSPISHGEAIALGMICESWISWKINGLTEKQYYEISKNLSNTYPTKEIDKKTTETLLSFMRNDKKNEGGKICFSLLRSIGDCSCSKKVVDGIIQESLEQLKKFKSNE